jgi:hypothetical protein
MRAFIILAFLLTAIPAAAQEQLGHFKTNPNGTDSISTPSGAYGSSGANAINNPTGSPYRMSGDVPADPTPNTPAPTKTSGALADTSN